MDAVGNKILEGLLGGSTQLCRSPVAWLNDLRAEALERANALSVPTTRDEDWRFTDLSPLYKSTFQPLLQPAAVDAIAVEPFLIPEASTRLVFVDGIYSAVLSTPAAEDGVTVGSIATAVATHGEFFSSGIGKLVDHRGDPFSAVNTAWLRDGAWIDLKALSEAHRPIHLLFVAASPGVAIHPRVLITAAAGSRCTLIEDFVSLHEQGGLTNVVTELFVGDGARIRQVRVQRESKGAFHIGTCAARVARDASYHNVSLAFGGRISRVNLNVEQAGEGTDCRLDGMALISGRQLADMHSFLDHAFAHGRSRQSHKCIVDGAAHAVFNGRILVRPGAQLTDAAQESRNLLLSERAQVDTKPQLEIFADDVKCAHGATVGQLDSEQTFYLRSRGLSERGARNLLTFAFGAEIIQRIPVPSLVARLEQAVMQQTQISKEVS